MKFMRMEEDGRITGTQVPDVGEQVMVEAFGRANVVDLRHDDFDNYIMLEYLDIIDAPQTYLERFTVR